MALINWDLICQPKTNGGLGLRKLEDQNATFIMKLGYNLVSNHNALLVNVLWSKYGLTDGLPITIVQSNNSFMWRGLSKIWPLIRDNMIWSVGNGNSIQC